MTVLVRRGPIWLLAHAVLLSLIFIHFAGSARRSSPPRRSSQACLRGGDQRGDAAALRMVLSCPSMRRSGSVVAERRRTGRPLPGHRLVVRATLVGSSATGSSYHRLPRSGVHLRPIERLILFTYPAFVTLRRALLRAADPAQHGDRHCHQLCRSGAIFATDRGTASAIDQGRRAGPLAAIAFALTSLSPGSRRPDWPHFFTCIAMSGAAAGAIHSRWTRAAQGICRAKLFGQAAACDRRDGAALFLLNAALQRISAQRTPRSARFAGHHHPFAVVILDEPFTLADAIGTALVIAGVGGLAVDQALTLPKSRLPFAVKGDITGRDRLKLHSLVHAAPAHGTHRRVGVVLGMEGHVPSQESDRHAGQRSPRVLQNPLPAAGRCVPPAGAQERLAEKRRHDQ